MYRDSHSYELDIETQEYPQSEQRVEAEDVTLVRELYQPPHHHVMPLHEREHQIKHALDREKHDIEAHQQQEH
jgi:hypothetical protein